MPANTQAISMERLTPTVIVAGQVSVAAAQLERDKFGRQWPSALLRDKHVHLLWAEPTDHRGNAASGPSNY